MSNNWMTINNGETAMAYSKVSSGVWRDWRKHQPRFKPNKPYALLLQEPPQSLLL